MRKLKEYFKQKLHIALSVPAVLCFITFILNLVKSLSDGIIDSSELHGLMATADGFETVVLFVVMFALKDKTK